MEILYGGQYTLSIQLISSNYLVLPATDAAPVSLETYPLCSFDINLAVLDALATLILEWKTGLFLVLR